MQERLPELQRELAEAFPEAAIMVQPFMQGPPVGAPLTLRVVGPDLDRLQELGEAMRGLLLETSGVTHAEAFVSAGPARLRVEPDLEAIAAAGLDAEAVARELRWALDGRAGGLIREGSEVVPVVTRLPPSERRDPASLRERRLVIPGEDGPRSLPLDALARVTLEPVPSGIFRKDGERVNFIQAYLAPYRMASPALAEFSRRLAESDVRLPPGYRLEVGGEAEGSSDARNRLFGVFAPLLVAMLAVLVLAFDSFLVPLLIWGVALGSIGWALLTLWLFGQPLGFTAVIGCMGVIGIAINDSVVVLNGIRGDPAAARANRPVCFGSAWSRPGTSFPPRSPPSAASRR
ncbi:MAG: efflux RND transporter permease subunit [Gammaproteobacteria bacterium]|nr:efflux RND transporter permease subunit [Gammaproteobacteria bacterium]